MREPSKKKKYRIGREGKKTEDKCPTCNPETILQSRITQVKSGETQG